MTKQAAQDEAERYIARLIESQRALGYKRPTSGVVKVAVGETAAALKALSALSANK